MTYSVCLKVLLSWNSLLTSFILSPYNTHHTGMGSNLDPGRTDVCTQINNYNIDMYNF